MTDGAEAFLEVLNDLKTALARNREVIREMDARVQVLIDALRARRSLREVVTDTQKPLLVQLLSESIDLLLAHGAQVRQTEARLLYAEGLNMDEIANLFGVTRQRVGALIREG